MVQGHFLLMRVILSEGGGRVGLPACITGNITKGFASRVSASGVGGGICLQGFCIRGCMYLGKYPRDTWDTVNKRAVRILLEFILVHRY